MEPQSLASKLLLILFEEWKLILILTAIFSLYFYYTATFDYFKKKGVPFMKPTILLGNLGPRIRATKSFHDYQLEIYNRFKGSRFGGNLGPYFWVTKSRHEHQLEIYNYFKGTPMGGIFEGRRPVLYIMDSDLIKAITIRDFDHFTDRNSLNNSQPRYMQQSLLNLKGAEWKGVRSTMTPVFSSARLKNMLPLLEVCTKQMITYFSQYENTDVEMKEAMGHYTLEVIGACAFGIKCDALNKEDSHFMKVARKFDYMSRSKRVFLLLVLMFAPKLLRMIKFSFLNLESTDELMRMLQIAKAERRATDSKKSDFLQILVDVANKENSEANKTGEKYLDNDTIDAQCLLFLVAGYETSSTLLSFAIHVLATKPELQDKLRAHIKQHTEGKEMSYELLSELTYLDAFLQETLRLYPPVSRVDRVVTKPYTLPGTSIHLNTGEIVAIPVYGIHMDPEYYPEPEIFRPERFMGDEKKERPSHHFMAFGAGPRNCIGLRFAMFSAKIAMVALIQNFKFMTCAKTQDPVIFDKRALLLKTSTGLWVRFEKL